MKIIKTKSFKLAIVTQGNKNAKKLAILIPGRLDTKDYIHLTSQAAYLAKRGFFTISFDPPGTWQSPGSIKLCTTTNYIKAINELINYFGNKPTLLLGHSRGATSAILASAVNHRIIGIVSIMANFGLPTAPSSQDIKRGYHLSYRDLPPGNVKTKKKKIFKLPLSYWTDGKKYNVKKTLQKCHVPKLIIYGLFDEFTKPKEVIKLSKTIPNPKTLVKINSNHDYRLHKNAIKQVEKGIGQFLTKFNF